MVNGEVPKEDLEFEREKQLDEMNDAEERGVGRRKVSSVTQGRGSRLGEIPDIEESEPLDNKPIETTTEIDDDID